VVYFTFAFVPVFIVYAGLLIAPSLAGYLSAEDPREMQKLLPALILEHTPMWTQVLFFGALLSAILSTASGALIAPTALCTENIIKQFYPRMGDRQFLLALRTVLVSFSLAALVFALNSKSTMYDMVQNAYKVTLVGAFVPLAAGIFWKRANVPGAAVSMIFGLGSWGVAELTAADATVPPQLVGLAFSILGMALGSLVPRERAVPHAPRRTPLI
jgi:Na+/proline symporter